jgi:hypothetical protein
MDHFKGSLQSEEKSNKGRGTPTSGTNPECCKPGFPKVKHRKCKHLMTKKVKIKLEKLSGPETVHELDISLAFLLYHNGCAPFLLEAGESS